MEQCSEGHTQKRQSQTHGLLAEVENGITLKIHNSFNTRRVRSTRAGSESQFILNFLRVICESLLVLRWAFHVSGDMEHSFPPLMLLGSSKNVHVAILFFLQATTIKRKNILRFILSRLAFKN